MIVPRSRSPHGPALALACALAGAGCGSRPPAAGGPAAHPAGTTAGSAAPPARDLRGRCEAAARNYATLVYWQRADAELAKLPEQEREVDRERRREAFTHELETQLGFFVDQCIAAANDAQVDCMIAAKTGDEAKQCAEPAKPD